MKPSINTAYISTRAVKPVVDGLDTLGLDIADLLQKAKINVSELGDAGDRIPHNQMMLLWQAAVKSSGDPGIGLKVAREVPLSAFTLHAYAFLSSPNLEVGLKRAVRYQRLIHETSQLTFEHTESEGTIFHYLLGGATLPRPPADFLATIWTRFAKAITAGHAVPLKVEFGHAKPEDLACYHTLFGGNLSFSADRTAVTFSRRALEFPNAQSDPVLGELMENYASKLLENVPDQQDFLVRIRSLLTRDMPEKLFTAAEIASQLGVSERSFYRELHLREVNFRELRDQCLSHKARRLLTNPDLGIAEVAFLLGFSETASFYRAFKRWTGTTPLEYRNSK